MSNQVRMRWVAVLAGAVALAAALLSGGGCAERINGTGTPPGVPVTLNLDLKAGPAITLNLTISGADMDTIRVRRVLDNGPAASFEVPFGNDRRFLVEALDLDGVVLYRGETVRDVISILPLVLDVDLQPVVPMIYLNPHFATVNVGERFSLVVCVNDLPGLDSIGMGVTFTPSAKGDKLFSPVLIDTVVLDPGQAERGAVLTYFPDGEGGVYFDVSLQGGSLVDANGDACLVTIRCTTQDTWAAPVTGLSPFTYIEYVGGVENSQPYLDTMRLRLVRQALPESYLDSGGADTGVALIPLGGGATMVGANATIVGPGEASTDNLYLVRLDADLKPQSTHLLPWGFLNTTGLARAAGGGYYAVANDPFNGGGIMFADDNGTEVWRQDLGLAQQAFAVAARPGGGGIMAGSWSNDGNHFLLVAFDRSGKSVAFQPTDFNTDQEFRAVVVLNDTTFVALGSERGFSGGNENIVLGKYTLGLRFAVVWERLFDTGGEDIGRDLLVTPDGGFLIVGAVRSASFGPTDVRVFKTDQLGQIEWARTFGGPDEDYGRAGTAAGDGGYVVAGQTSQIEGFAADILVAKVSAGGDLLWQRVHGGPGVEQAADIIRSGSGYLIVGTSSEQRSNGQDVLLLKVNGEGR